ncbi:MAG: hypothetical protein K6E85_17735 [Lachnospiraceae bacterium]|nr:hypothetical protein [Lachnospiraceae bacterium]
MNREELQTYCRTVLDDAREAIFIFDEEGFVVYANKTAYAETKYPDLSRVSISDIYPMAAGKDSTPDDWAQLNDFETFAYRENRSCYPVKLSCARIADSHYIAAYGVNDSERVAAVENHNKAMEEVEAATKMKNEFTANITHELRTPINGIKGMAEGLTATQLSPEQDEAVGVILHCCENMSKIINDLLDFSKIAAGKLELESREFSLDKLLKDTLAIHVSKINEKGLKLMVNVSGPVPERIVGDELRLGQILNNLLSNATKFTSSGHIGVELSANRSYGKGEVELFFMIIDTGIGISDSEKDKLFKSFSQVDGSITRRFGGTGLGLAITKQLVEMMGGKISVDSQKGSGSTFSFTVKLKEAGSLGARLDFPEGSFEYSNAVAAKAASGAGTAQIEDYTSFGGTGNGYGDANGFEDDGTDGDDEILSEEAMYEKIRQELEKTRICMELGAWEKAEGFAENIRDMVTKIDPEMKSKAFSLLLNVRKEKIDAAGKLADELTKKYQADLL